MPRVAAIVPVQLSALPFVERKSRLSQRHSVVPGTDDEAPTNGLHPQRIVYDTEINAARNILARATDPQINRYTATHEVKRILIDRAGTVELPHHDTRHHHPP